MNTTEFLRRVLPPDGYYVSLALGKGRPHQQFHATVDELADKVQDLSDAGHNTYYAVASFVDTSSRKATNIHALQALFLDVDCGPDKPFPSWQEGLRAVGAFVAEHMLPRPMIVSSGVGLHVYWMLEHPVSYAEWHRYAAGLKSLIPTLDGVAAFDPTVPADGARVLRPVGTTNPKNGAQVRVLLDAAPVSLEAMRPLLDAAASQIPARTVKVAASPLLAAMAVPSDFPPADPTAIAERCAQVRWAIDHPDRVKEPLWYAVLGVASACVDPEQVAITWSQGHPGFSPDDTLAKLDQWRGKTTGPATCARFESERPDGCAGCKYAGRIGTPARLGVVTADAPPATNAPDQTAQDVPLPRPFKRTSRGIVVTIDDIEVDVCKFDIYPVGYGRDEVLGYETVRYRWNRPHVGWQPLAFRQAFLADSAKRDFTSAIADQGIVLASAKQTEYFQVMLRAYMEELRQMRTMTNLYSTMGWKTANTQFLLGDTLYTRSATGVVTNETATLAGTTMRSHEPMFVEAGTLAQWAAFTSLLDKARMPVHMFALCVSLSAPLYAFTGLKGLTVNLYGPTGSGKTLAQYWQQSIWGDPNKLHYTAKFTSNALFARIGMYNNLPVTIDETTMLPPKEIGDFLYWVSQGRDKARLTRHAEERDVRTWATVVTTSSNRSMSSMLASTGMESDAQMARLLELTLDKHVLFAQNTSVGQRIYQFLADHHGTAGREFLSYIMALGEVGVRAAIDDHRKRFFAKYACQFSGSERYWEQCVQLADLAGEIAAERGMIQFDYREGIKHVIEQLGVARTMAKESAIDAFDLLAEYMNEFAGSTITVFHTGASKQADLNRLPRGEVRVRLDLYRTVATAAFAKGVMLIDRTHFRSWLAMRGADYRGFVKELQAHSAYAPVRNDKSYLGKDTPIKLGQQYVLGVNLAHPRMAGVLSDAEDAAATLSVVATAKP